MFRSLIHEDVNDVDLNLTKKTFWNTIIEDLDLKFSSPNTKLNIQYLNNMTKLIMKLELNQVVRIFYSKKINFVLKKHQKWRTTWKRYTFSELNYCDSGWMHYL